MNFFDVSYYLYFPMYKFAKYFLEKVCDGVSTRHSFYFKKVVFLISDIDITLFHKSIIDPKSAKRMRNRFNWLKKIIPILGECNIYDKLSIGPLAVISNPLEVARDPFLLSHIRSSSEPLLAQKLIFILRLFKGDQKNLRFRLSKRYKKLSYCLSLLNPKRELDPRDVSSLDFLVRYLKENVIDEAGWGFLDYLVLKILHVELDKCLYEEIWNIEKLDTRNLLEMSSLEREMLVDNILWEFWGLYTQIAFVKDHRLSTNYLLIQKENLMMLCENQKLGADRLQAVDLIVEQFQNFIGE